MIFVKSEISRAQNSEVSSRLSHSCKQIWNAIDVLIAKVFLVTFWATRRHYEWRHFRRHTELLASWKEKKIVKNKNRKSSFTRFRIDYLRLILGGFFYFLSKILLYFVSICLLHRSIQACFKLTQLVTFLDNFLNCSEIGF